MSIGHSVYIAPEWQRRLTVREYHQMIDAGVVLARAAPQIHRTRTRFQVS